MDLEHAEIARPLAALAALAVTPLAVAPLAVALAVALLLATASCGGGAAEHLCVELQHARGGEEDDDLVPGEGEGSGSGYSVIGLGL